MYFRQHKRLLIYLVIIVALLAAATLYGPFYRRFIHNMPGDVIGTNAKHIPKSKLPICEFDGSHFVREPCYSPPGSIYD